MPSTSDKRYFNVGPELVKVLHITSVDAPVATLLSSSNIPGEPEDRLRPNDRRADHSLQRSHQRDAWAIHSPTSASFFKRTTLIWLRHLQENVPASDIQLHQDLNKIVAAVQFSADTTLHSAHFVAKAMASSVAARGLIWLRNWQADTHHKWHLAYAPFMGERLFGEALDPLRRTSVRSFRRPNGEANFNPHPFSAGLPSEGPT